jgi:FkbM family methyltransferase
MIPVGAVLPIVSGPLRGARWLAGAAAGEARGLSVLVNRCEPTALARVASLVRPDDVCFDLGANVGLYSLLFARRARQVVAFEPSPRNLAFLVRTHAANRCENVTVVPWAVSDADGMTRFTAGPNIAQGHLSTAGEQPTATTSLDSFVRTFGVTPSLIKMDVEGAELAVLQGASALLREAAPRLVIEMHSPGLHEGCIGLLRSHGYTRFEQVAENGSDVIASR